MEDVSSLSRLQRKVLDIELLVLKLEGRIQELERRDAEREAEVADMQRSIQRRGAA